MAEIQFVVGMTEKTVPDVRLSRSKRGDNSTARFYFEDPDIFTSETPQTPTGLYMLDQEGQLVTRKVNAKFVNGKPKAIEAVYSMKNEEEWQRFLRFMDRYAKSNGMKLNKS